jgi:hypothetical protein
MTSLTVFDFGSQGIRFEQSGDRVWVCLTDMAKANGKLVADWARLKSTQEYLIKLQSVMGIPITETTQGGIPELQGTWAIDEVAIDFAAWCSVDFRIWVNQQIKTLMTTGKVELKPEPTEPQIPLIQRQGLTAVETMHKTLDFAKQLGNQRLIQQIEVQISQYYDAYVSLKQLPPFNQTEQEQKSSETAIDVAIRLGFSVPGNFEGKLGGYVKSCCEHLILDVKDNRTAANSGKRLAVNCYPANNEEIESAVIEYCTMMQAKLWRTIKEQKAWEKENK